MLPLAGRALLRRTVCVAAAGLAVVAVVIVGLDLALGSGSTGDIAALVEHLADGLAAAIAVIAPLAALLAWRRARMAGIVTGLVLLGAGGTVALRRAALACAATAAFATCAALAASSWVAVDDAPSGRPVYESGRWLLPLDSGRWLGLSVEDGAGIAPAPTSRSHALGANRLLRPWHWHHRPLASRLAALGAIAVAPFALALVAITLALTTPIRLAGSAYALHLAATPLYALGLVATLRALWLGTAWWLAVVPVAGATVAALAGCWLLFGRGARI
ncbi:MAG TPA: hypothetical protein VEL07_01510 [Planctomycetota bacterium]|nr:hypothetical protein [Planctomycetota bacterium]